MKTTIGLILAIIFFTACSSMKTSETKNNWNEIKTSQKLNWRAVHLLNYTTDKKLQDLSGQLPGLAKIGINTIILEVDYHFDFQSHPELRQTDSVITLQQAQRFSQLCTENNIKLIPQFQCLGHQSWAKDTYKLLEVYPELDLTPNAFPGNEGLYCREWDVMNPRVYEIVLPLMDEIVAAFNADAIHVGMDEVFLLGSEQSPSTKGMDPAALYTKAINDLHDHLVKKKGLTMMMWGDRLINGEEHKFGDWEASTNNTWQAIDQIPNDIIICDWHYEPLENYPKGVDGYTSIPMFIEKGFRVIPTSWRNVDGMKSLMYYSLLQENEKMLGHLFTLWSMRKGDSLLTYSPMVEGLKLGKPFFASE